MRSVSVEMKIISNVIMYVDNWLFSKVNDCNNDYS